MENRLKRMGLRLILGLVSLILGFIAANLALFHWIEGTNIYYLLGDYARYACAYGGFAAMILGSMLINDFLNFRRLLNEKNDLNNSIFGK